VEEGDEVHALNVLMPGKELPLPLLTQRIVALMDPRDCLEEKSVELSGNQIIIRLFSSPYTRKNAE
jgi:hypothetical protein